MLKTVSAAPYGTYIRYPRSLPTARPATTASTGPRVPQVSWKGVVDGAGVDIELFPGVLDPRKDDVGYGKCVYNMQLWHGWHPCRYLGPLAWPPGSGYSDMDDIVPKLDPLPPCTSTADCACMDWEGRTPLRAHPAYTDTTVPIRAGGRAWLGQGK